MGSNFVLIHELPPTPTGALGRGVHSTSFAHAAMTCYEINSRVKHVEPFMFLCDDVKRSIESRFGPWHTEQFRMSSGWGPGQASGEMLHRLAAMGVNTTLVLKSESIHQMNFMHHTRPWKWMTAPFHDAIEPDLPRLIDFSKCMSFVIGFEVKSDFGVIQPYRGLGRRFNPGRYHAVTVVGYGKDGMNGPPAWKIQNSDGGFGSVLCSIVEDYFLPEPC